MGKARILGNIGTNAGNLATTATGIDVTGTVSADVVSSTTLTSDGITSDEYLISAISASIADTAVDIFVYNTAKDSDGGAWRKRTQHTSWYNETLGTGTRGSRKEFPAVAVIVAESNQVTIYDGDDPDLPMWMVFNKGGGWTASSNLIATTASAVKASQAVNATLVVAISDGYGIMSINFISELTHSIQFNVDFPYLGNIALRNSGSGYGGSYSTNYILTGTVNDVAMTVLPNAPIDAATGLPVPTIAVATNGGVSVIKDDGTVVDLMTNVGTSQSIAFTSTGGIQTHGGGGYGYYGFGFKNIPSSDTNTQDYYIGSAWGANQIKREGSIGNSGLYPIVATKYGSANREQAGSSTNDKLMLIDANYDAYGYSNVAYATSTYNTGWMNGDIKLATLSDTDATNVTGAELVTNGTFDSNTSGWTAGDGATVTHQSGRMRVDGNVGTANQAITTVVGKSYTVSADLFNGTSASSAIYVSTTTSSAQMLASFASPANSVTFTATSTTTYIIARVNAATNTYIEVDNVSVRLAEEDRSVNNKGLQVFGTVTKTAVATGADLVAYSGFSSSNYLQHTVPTNYGSPAVVSFMGWQKTSDISNYQYMASLSDGTSGNLLGLSVNSSSTGASAGKPYLYHNVNSSLEATTRVDDGTWHFMVGVFDGTSKKLYIDGKLNASATVTALAMTNVTATNVGFYSPNITGTKQYFHLGSIALLRISATAPSAAQIAKMYNDEKHLFQENAKATLYGASDAVTALAYDDDTELLHVGTSAGRSVFQGLRRIDNTTDAVGVAISASNGMVAED